MWIENLAFTMTLLPFSNAQDILPKEIHHQIAAFYGNKVRDESLIRRWVREFNEQTVCDRKCSRRLSLITEELKNVPVTSLQMMETSNESDYHFLFFAKLK